MLCCVCGFPASDVERQHHERPSYDGSAPLPFRHSAAKCWQLARAEIERLEELAAGQCQSVVDECAQLRADRDRLRAALERVFGIVIEPFQQANREVQIANLRIILVEALREPHEPPGSEPEPYKPCHYCGTPWEACVNKVLNGPDGYEAKRSNACCGKCYHAEKQVNSP